MYKFRPVKFYLITLTFTWIFWITAAVFSHMEGEANMAISMALMFFGLIVPCVTAFTFVKKSESKALKDDYKAKLVGFLRLKPLNIILAMIVFAVTIFASIGVSLFFGESTDQFSFAEGFSFSIGGMPTLFLLILTALFEELGWRGYAEDSIAQYNSWFKESVIFGLLWGAWHIPLFFIEGTYQSMILQMNPWYMVNFFVGTMPLGFIITWVYIKNNRSIFACCLFHFIVNFLQEQINMTQNTKCIETGIMFIVAAIVVLCNKDAFFEKRHVGNILGE